MLLLSPTPPHLWSLVLFLLGALTNAKVVQNSYKLHFTKQVNIPLVNDHSAVVETKWLRLQRVSYQNASMTPDDNASILFTLTFIQAPHHEVV